jgi:peptide/nickel transport system permease protein
MSGPIQQIDTPPAELLDLPVAAPHGFWVEAWLRFRRRPRSLAALVLVVCMGFVALLAPAIAGTKPVVCRYKGHLYFPALGYFNPKWENAVFQRDGFRRRYPNNLREKDSDSWAIWPLVFQDPYRRVAENEWPGRPANPIHDQGRPSRLNWFGTTAAGVDVFAMMVHGTTIALLVGFVSIGIAASIGVVLGALAGYFRGWVDMLISRLIEVVMCIPALVLILALIAVIKKPTIWHTMAVLGATGWTGIARLTRGEFMRLREMEFVTAARALGARQPRIIFRHVLPNALAPLLVPVSFGIAGAILIESGLSFLGFGSPPPNPSWGTLLNAARANLEMWWLVVFPGGAIFLAVLAYNLIGDGLQEATDPRLRGGKQA